MRNARLPPSVAILAVSPSLLALDLHPLSWFGLGPLIAFFRIVTVERQCDPLPSFPEFLGTGVQHRDRAELLRHCPFLA